MKKSFNFSKIIAIVFLLLLIVMLVFQIYNYLYLTIRTDYAMEASMEDSFEVTGIVCRNEKVLSASNLGYYDVIRETGEKVSRGGTIANVYAQASDVKSEEKIRLIDSLIEEYSGAISAKNSYSGDSANYDLQIQNSLEDYVGSVHDHDPQRALSALVSFEKNVYIKQIVSGQAADYQEEIMALRSEKSKLKNSLSTNVSKVSTDISGYFVKSTDGYESTLTIDALKDYSIADFNDLFSKINDASSEESKYIGKIIPDYKWQFYFICSKNALNQYKVGKSLSLRFAASGNNTINGIIISMQEEGENCLVGVECINLEPDLLSDRLLEATVIIKSYSGIRVDKNSLRIIDGEHGVFVKVGSIIKFKKVNVLYSGSTYALIEKQTNGISNFDEIVVDGKNLYDGKILS